MKKVTLIVDVITTDEVYQGNYIEYHPSIGETVKITGTADFLKDYSMEKYTKGISAVVPFHKVNPLDKTETTYIAMTDKAEKLLKFPFNHLIEENKDLESQNDRLFTKITNYKILNDKYTIMKRSFWGRLKFVLTGEIDNGE